MTQQLIMPALVGEPFDWTLSASDFARAWARGALAARPRPDLASPGPSAPRFQCDLWPGEVLDAPPAWAKDVGRPDRKWSTAPRPMSIPTRRLTRREKTTRAAREQFEAASTLDADRPRTRADCELGQCPWCDEKVGMEVRFGEPHGSNADQSDGAQVRKADGPQARGDEGRTEGSHEAAVAGALRLRPGEGGRGGEPAERADDELWVLAAEARDVRDGGVHDVEIDVPTVLQPKDGEVPQLRGPGHHGVRALDGGRRVPAVPGGHGEEAVTRSLSRPNRRERQLRTGQLPMGDDRGAGSEQAHFACPRCERRVRYDRGVGSQGWAWRKYGEGEAEAGLDAGGGAETSADFGRAVGHCRPCLRPSCRQHLYLDVSEKGWLKLNHPHLAVDEMTESCALDVADRDGITLERLGQLLNISLEGARQVEADVMEELRAKLGVDAVAAILGSRE